MNNIIKGTSCCANFELETGIVIHEIGIITYHEQPDYKPI